MKPQNPTSLALEGARLLLGLMKAQLALVLQDNKRLSARLRRVAGGATARYARLKQQASKEHNAVRLLAQEVDKERHLLRLSRARVAELEALLHKAPALKVVP